MNFTNNLSVNKKKLLKIVISLGIGSSLLISSENFGLHFEGCKPDFYYLNTKDIDMNSEDLQRFFENKFKSSSVLVEEFNCIYPEISNFIGQYGEYLDQEQLLDTIYNLDVDIVTTEKYGTNILGWYTFKDNTIHLKDKIKYKKDENVKEVKEHEVFHYLFFQGLSGSFFNIQKRGLSLDEGMATLLTQENGDFANTVMYKKNANYVRVLCELIGPENFISACGNHNINELYDYLSEYSSQSTARELIKCIDEACLNWYYVTDADEDAWNIINTMYENKTGTTIENSDDYIMKYYSNKMLKTCYEIDGARSVMDINVYKNYFLNRENPRIEFERDGEVYNQIMLNENLENSKVKIRK